MRRADWIRNYIAGLRSQREESYRARGFTGRVEHEYVPPTAQVLQLFSDALDMREGPNRAGVLDALIGYALHNADDTLTDKDWQAQARRYRDDAPLTRDEYWEQIFISSAGCALTVRGVLPAVTRWFMRRQISG